MLFGRRPGARLKGMVFIMFAWWNDLSMVQQVFYIIAIPSTLILLIQTVLLFFGLGHDSETDVDHDVDTDVDHDFDMVTSVPLHKTRLRQRGYNQSEELARRIAADMELPYMPLLQRTRETPSQTRLTLSQRRKNPIGAFSVLPDAVVEGKRILLIDDVVTTGATALECVTVLRAKGAKRVAIGGICAGRSREGYSSSNV